jgi:hypothetical protein
MDNEFGRYTDAIIYDLQSSDFSNEYYDMTSIQRLKFLNRVLEILGYYAGYDVEED